jgi:hypothetical protein
MHATIHSIVLMNQIHLHSMDVVLHVFDRTCVRSSLNSKWTSRPDALFLQLFLGVLRVCMAALHSLRQNVVATRLGQLAHGAIAISDPSHKFRHLFFFEIALVLPLVYGFIFAASLGGVFEIGATCCVCMHYIPSPSPLSLSHIIYRLCAYVSVYVGLFSYVNVVPA